MGVTTFIFIAIAFSTAVSGTVALPRQTPAPLQLSLSCARSPELAFRLTIQIVSPGPAAAVIGQILANDKKYQLAPATLTLTRSGESDVTLTYVDVTVPGIAGRLDPWLVMLPARAVADTALEHPHPPPAEGSSNTT